MIDIVRRVNARLLACQMRELPDAYIKLRMGDMKNMFTELDHGDLILAMYSRTGGYGTVSHEFLDQKRLVVAHI